MKNICLRALSTVFIIALSFYSFAQAPSIQWQVALGGTGNDVANAIQQTSDSGFIVVGYSTSTDGNVTGNHGGQDYWAVKLSSAGAIQWQKSYGGSADDIANSVQQTADGGYIIAGYTGSVDGDVTGNHGGFDDAWIVKISSAGSIEWEKAFGGSVTDKAYSIRQTTDGGYIFSGSTNSDNGDVSGNHGSWDSWVVKLSSAGAIQWQKTLGGSTDEEGTYIQQTFDSGYIVANYSNSTDGDITGNNGGYDFWVVKLSSSGGIQWQKSLGGSIDDEAWSILQSADSGYVVTGFTASGDGDVVGNHGIYDYWVVKLSDTGAIEWRKCFGGSGIDYAYASAPCKNGDFIIAGNSTSDDGDVTGNHGNTDYWVADMNYLGFIQWQISLGGSNADGATAVLNTLDGGYIVAGGSSSSDGNVTGNHGGNDYWIVKLGPSQRVSEPVVSGGNGIVINPNPTTGNIYVTGGNNVNISVYNLPGQLIKQVSNTNVVSISEFPPGMYFVKVFDEQGIVQKQEKVIRLQ